MKKLDLVKTTSAVNHDSLKGNRISSVTPSSTTSVTASHSSIAKKHHNQPASGSSLSACSTRSSPAPENPAKSSSSAVYDYVTHVKTNNSVHLPTYYPLTYSNMLIKGPAPLMCNRFGTVSGKIKHKSPMIHCLEFLDATVINDELPGVVSFEKISDGGAMGKSFTKLVSILKQHFPHLSV